MADPFSDRVEAEANALWMADCSTALFNMLEESFEKPHAYRAFIAGLMLRYGLALHDSTGSR